MKYKISGLNAGQFAHLFGQSDEYLKKTPCSTTNGRVLSGLSRQNLIVRYPRWRKRPPD